MSVPVEALGYHVGIVVEDVADAAAAFGGLLGGPHISWEFDKPAPTALDPTYEDSSVRVAYGRFGGMTIELIQVLHGSGHYARWLAAHGPGVQHLGFWVPDVAAATRGALRAGATLRSATLDKAALAASGIGVVTVRADPDAVAAAIRPGSVHVAIGDTPVEVEFVGPAGLATLQDVLGDACSDLLDRPPWAG